MNMSEADDDQVVIVGLFAIQIRIRNIDCFSKMHDTYLGLTPEEFTSLVRRYKQFQEALNDTFLEPVKVFHPLSEKSLAELYLNREVTKDLQKKKEEDMKKKDAEEPTEAEEKSEEKTEDKAEEKKLETEK